MGENPEKVCPFCDGVSFAHHADKGETVCGNCGYVADISMEHSYESSHNDCGSGHGPFSSDQKFALGSSGMGLPRNLKTLQIRSLKEFEGSRAKRRARKIIKSVTHNGWRDGRNRALRCLERAWPNSDGRPEHPQFRDAYSVASCEGTQFTAVACVKIALDSMGTVVPTSEYLRHIQVDLPNDRIKRFFLRTVKQVRLNITIADPKLRCAVQGSNLDFLSETSQKNRSQAIIDLAVSRLDLLQSIRQNIYNNVQWILQSNQLQSHHMKTIVSAVIYHTAKQCKIMVTQQMICDALEISNSFRTLRNLVAEIISSQNNPGVASIERNRKVIA